MLLEASRGSSCPPNLDIYIQADGISLWRLLEASVALSSLLGKDLSEDRFNRQLIFKLSYQTQGDFFTQRNANIAIKIYKQNHFILPPSILCFPICSVCIRLKYYL